jgi:hypothetical protein
MFYRGLLLTYLFIFFNKRKQFVFCLHHLQGNIIILIFFKLINMKLYNTPLNVIMTYFTALVR